MKRLEGVDNGRVSLEVVECDCGFHFGLDATYMDQVEDFTILCPSCGREIDTAIVFPEDPETEEEEIQIPGELRGTTEKTLEEDIRILINLLGQMKGMRVGMNKENCEFRPLREEHVDLMTLQKWKAVVKEGGFMDSDGSGYLATEDAVSDLYILPSCVFEVTLPDWATHVAWYNK